MKISLSIAAQDRLFSKAIRKVRPNFDALFEAFSEVKITNPIHEAILIGFDSAPADYFEVIQNRDGFFQVLAGLKSNLEQNELKVELFKIIEQAVQSCPFTNSDKKRFTDLLHEWKPKLI